MRQISSRLSKQIFSLCLLGLVPVALLAWSLHLSAQSEAEERLRQAERNQSQELNAAARNTEAYLQNLLVQASNQDASSPAVLFRNLSQLPHVATAVVFDSEFKPAYPQRFHQSHPHPFALSKPMQSQSSLRKTDSPTDALEQLSDYSQALHSTERLYALKSLAQAHPRLVPNDLIEAEEHGLHALMDGVANSRFPQLTASNKNTFLLLTAPKQRFTLVFKPSLLEDLSKVAGRELTLFDTFRLHANSATPGPGKTLHQTPLTGNLLGWTLSASPTPIDTTATTSQKLQYTLLSSVAIAVIAIALYQAAFASRQREALLAAKTSVIASVTHELKTPVTATRLFVETLQDAGEDRELRQKYLQLIADENHRLNHTIDSFLSFSQIETGRIELELSPQDPSHILQAAAQSFCSRRPHSAERLHLHLAPDLENACIQADPIALAGALLNLIDNAYKYSPPDSPIQASLHRDAQTITYTVSDQGYGITPKNQSLIFEAFYQVTAKGQLAASGCGLGLTIVRFVADAHHGSIGVESQPNKGSVFKLSIPIETAPNSHES